MALDRRAWISFFHNDDARGWAEFEGGLRRPRQRLKDAASQELWTRQHGSQKSRPHSLDIPKDSARVAACTPTRKDRPDPYGA